MGIKVSKSEGNLVLGYTASNSQKKEIDSSTQQTLTAGSSSNSVGTLSSLNDSGGQLLISSLTSSTNIELCSKNLISLHSNIALLTDATSLMICCNKLSSIPSEIGYLYKNLTTLSLARNEIVELPESIGFLVNLVELRLSNNQLKTLPKSIIALQKLHTLSISSNQFSWLPVEIASLKKLTLLDASSNPLRVLPAELLRLKNLRRIRLDDCPLVTGFSAPMISYAPPLLKELAARSLVRNNHPIISNPPSSIKNYLLSVQECSFCGGPFFEHYAERGRLVAKNEFMIPIVYRLCVSHWSTEEERVQVMFKKAPSTAPQYALTKSPSSGSLLNYFSYLPTPSSSTAAAASTSNRQSLTVPLSSLAASPSMPLFPDRKRASSSLMLINNRSGSTLELPSFAPQERPRSKSFSNLLSRRPK